MTSRLLLLIVGVLVASAAAAWLTIPGWGGADMTKDQDSWKLVHFIRHLPALAQQELREMRQLNPKSRHELEEEEALRRFLSGEAAAPAHEDRHEH